MLDTVPSARMKSRSSGILVFFILKGIVFPRLLLRAIRSADVRHEDEPIVGHAASILLGILMLLHTLELLDFEYVARYWPVLLIAAGAYLLYGRFTGRDAAPKEMGHER